MNIAERKEQNEKHASEPMPGDYWHDHFCPVYVVLGRVAGRVLVCDKTQSTDDDHWTWDLDGAGVKLMTFAEFREHLSYKSIPGLWADVVPEAHKDVVRYFESMTKVAT